MAAPALPAAIFAVLMPWAIYRRVRTNIGRQKLSPVRLKARLAVMLVLIGVFGGPALLAGRLDAALGLLAGGTIGLLIGLLALRHTRFETQDGVDYYVPHLYLGLALSSLLLARMGYRFYEMWPLMNQPGGVPSTPLATISALTLGLLSLILAYNATFCLGLLRRSAKPKERP